MKNSSSNWLLSASMAAVMSFGLGCGDDDPVAGTPDAAPDTTPDAAPDDTDAAPDNTNLGAAWNEARMAGIEGLCRCFAFGWGYFDVPSCVAYWETPRDVCRESVYTAKPEDYAGYVQCQIDAEQNFADCMLASTCGEDLGECFANQAAAFETCAADPALEAFDTDYAACVDEMIVGPAGTCPGNAAPPASEDALGDAVFSGSTMLAGTDSETPNEQCGLPPGWPTAADLAFQWTAPSAGSFKFVTDADFDTILYALADDCDGASLGCNDNDMQGVRFQQSGLTLDLESGDTIVLVVRSARADDAGQVAINISDVTP